MTIRRTTDADLVAAGKRLAESEPPLTDEQVEAAAQFFHSLQQREQAVAEHNAALADTG